MSSQWSLFRDCREIHWSVTLGMKSAIKNFILQQNYPMLLRHEGCFRRNLLYCASNSFLDSRIVILLVRSIWRFIHCSKHKGCCSTSRTFSGWTIYRLTPVCVWSNVKYGHVNEIIKSDYCEKFISKVCLFIHSYNCRILDVGTHFLWKLPKILLRAFLKNGFHIRVRNR